MAIKIRHFSPYYLKNVSMYLQIQEPPNEGIITIAGPLTLLLFTNLLGMFSSLKYCSSTQL